MSNAPRTKIKDLPSLTREDYEDMTVDMGSASSITYAVLINTVMNLQDRIRSLEDDIIERNL